MRKTTLFIIGSLALIIIAMVATWPPTKPKKIASPGYVQQKITPVDKSGFKPAPEFSLKDVSGIEKSFLILKAKLLLLISGLPGVRHVGKRYRILSTFIINTKNKAWR